MTNIISIKALRNELGLNQLEFGALIGLANKASVSLIETGARSPDLDQALAIENLSIRDGVPRIDAAQLNDDVARARAACPGGCAIADSDAVLDHAALDSGSDANASTGQFGQMSRAVAA